MRGAQNQERRMFTRNRKKLTIDPRFHLRFIQQKAKPYENLSFSEISEELHESASFSDNEDMLNNCVDMKIKNSIHEIDQYEVNSNKNKIVSHINEREIKSKEYSRSPTLFSFKDEDSSDDEAKGKDQLKEEFKEDKPEELANKKSNSNNQPLKKTVRIKVPLYVNTNKKESLKKTFISENSLIISPLTRVNDDYISAGIKSRNMRKSRNSYDTLISPKSADKIRHHKSREITLINEQNNIIFYGFEKMKIYKNYYYIHNNVDKILKEIALALKNRPTNRVRNTRAKTFKREQVNSKKILKRSLRI